MGEPVAEQRDEGDDQEGPRARPEEPVVGADHQGGGAGEEQGVPRRGSVLEPGRRPAPQADEQGGEGEEDEHDRPEHRRRDGQDERRAGE